MRGASTCDDNGDLVLYNAVHGTLAPNYQMYMYAAGELFFFGYNVKKAPHVTYKIADPSGRVLSSVEITIPRGIMMHDFAITQDYAIFLDCPMVFKPDVRFPSILPWSLTSTHLRLVRLLVSQWDPLCIINCS